MPGEKAADFSDWDRIFRFETLFEFYGRFGQKPEGGRLLKKLIISLLSFGLINSAILPLLSWC